MKFIDILRFSAANFLRGRLRSLLTICSISIGVASVILVLALGDGSRTAISNELDRMGLEGIMIYPKQAAISQGVSLAGSDAYELVANVEGIDKSMPIMIRYGSYRLKNWQGNAMIYGVDPTMRDVLKVELLYGRLLNTQDTSARRDVVVVSDDLAEMIYMRKNIVGKELKLFIGERSRSFEIVGIVSSQQNSLAQMLGGLPKFFYVPYTSLMALANEDAIDEVIILSESEVVADRAVSYLDRKYSSPNSFRYENIYGIRDKVDNVIYLLTLFISSIAGIAIVVAGIGIMNTMMSQAIERKHEIGIYLTLGATSRDIMLSFLTESAVLSAIGGLLGIVLSIIPVAMARSATNIPFSIQISHVVLAESVAVMCGIIFGVSPASRAASLNPIDAIHSI